MSDLTRRDMLTHSSALIAASTMAAGSHAAAPQSFKGKSFLVTGAASGFGRLGSLHYARLGGKVFATMRNLPRPEAESLVKIAKAEKLDLHIIELDVLSDKSVKSAVIEAERINGGALDIVINNAGVVIAGPVEVHDMEATRLAFDTNLFGYHRVARAVLPGMRARKAGLIVNISSQVGRVIFPFSGVYSATKFAVESMSEQLAYELVPHGIDVVIIQPGGYPTRVGSNGKRHMHALADRAEKIHTDGYPEMMKRMTRGPDDDKAPPPAAYAPDPMDVPRAIAEIAAMPPGKRPLRRAVHPKPKPQEAINRVSAETQLALLEKTPYAAWARAVLD